MPGAVLIGEADLVEHHDADAMDICGVGCGGDDDDDDDYDDDDVDAAA